MKHMIITHADVRQCGTKRRVLNFILSSMKSKQSVSLVWSNHGFFVKKIGAGTK